MSVATQKLNLIQWISGLQDSSTLKVLETIKEQSSMDDWWDDLSVAEKISIEKGLSDALTGKTTSHSEVKKRYEQWLM